MDNSIVKPLLLFCQICFQSYVTHVDSCFYIWGDNWSVLQTQLNIMLFFFNSTWYHEHLSVLSKLCLSTTLMAP